MITMTSDTNTNNRMRLAHLGIHYGLVHEALLNGKKGWARRFAQPLLAQGDASTQWYMGLMYQTGAGVKQNFRTASRWYEKSAAQGFRMAEDGLQVLRAMATKKRLDENSMKSPWSGRIYRKIETLRCCPQERDAVFWEYQRGASLNNVEMQVLVGMCYERGIHVQRHLDTALEWYRRAAVLGSDRGFAMYKSLNFSMFGEEGIWDVRDTGVVSKLAQMSSLSGPEPANPLDAFWTYHAAAENGDRYACWRLHEFYLTGDPCGADRVESAKWLEKALSASADESTKRMYNLLKNAPELVLSEHEALLLDQADKHALMDRPHMRSGLIF